MRILWLCNIIIPAIARELGLGHSVREGWLSGYHGQLLADGHAELAVCFPYFGREMTRALTARVEGEALGDGRVARFKIDKMLCYAFRENINTPERYDGGLEGQMSCILADFRPDIIHIFGSEFPHALAMARVCGEPERLLLSMQGLMGKCAEAYMAGLPAPVISSATFRDVIRRDMIVRQQEKFLRRAAHEQTLFARLRHVAGRTDFDREAAHELNPALSYHHLGESLRAPFYQGRWEREKCQPHSIFLSQGDYPIKGFHHMLAALAVILRDFPSAHLYVAGNSIIGRPGRSDLAGKIKDRVKLSAYGRHILALLSAHQLTDKVTMLGKLDDEAMKERYLASSVFVCPSAVENSPNSLGEAMLLGVPVVAAAVGGIPSLLDDGKEGLLYQAGSSDDLAAAIKNAWDSQTAMRISAGAAKRAATTHDRVQNYRRLMEIYEEIST